MSTNDNNRSKQLNPNNIEYWKSHGFTKRPKDWKERAEKGNTQP